MKECKRCGEFKSLDQFSRNRQAADGKRSYCRSCDSYIRIQNGSKKRPSRQDLLDFLRDYPCFVCGLSDPVVADLHHIEEPRRQANGKRMAFSNMVNGTTGEGVFLRELAKCVTLCANCHRRIHAGVSDLPSRRFTVDELEKKLREYEAAYAPETREGELICTRCRTWKKTEEFYRDRANARGYQSWCKQCKK